VRRANRTRLREAGADSVMRPVRFYPEIVVRAIDSPGTEQILESIFMSDSDECRSFDAAVRGISWSALVSALMARGLGTAIAYRDPKEDVDHNVRCNPAPEQIVDTDRIYVIVKPERHVTETDIKAALATVDP
jgi:voltage-gated potassium channel